MRGQIDGLIPDAFADHDGSMRQPSGNKGGHGAEQRLLSGFVHQQRHPVPKGENLVIGMDVQGCRGMRPQPPRQRPRGLAAAVEIDCMIGGCHGLTFHTAFCPIFMNFPSFYGEIKALGQH